jgi:hypothetical protein
MSTGMRPFNSLLPLVLLSLMGCASTINVETFKGVVQLTGFVNSQDDINRAVDVARDVDDVTSVENDMRLKVPNP